MLIGSDNVATNSFRQYYIHIYISSYVYICIVISFTVTCQHGYFGEQQDLVYSRNNCNKAGSVVQNAVDKREKTTTLY